MGKVRVVYLIPADRKPQSAYMSAIAYAIADVRWWYRQQLDGATFMLRGNVEIVRSDKPANWFHGNKKVGTFYYNSLREVGKVLGAKQNDPHWVWVIYCDAPGDGTGLHGVCVLPEQDLLGLINANPSDKRVERWRGGLAHEVGHALLLDHPCKQAAGCLYSTALMYLGYLTYPKTYLTKAEKAFLMKSPFIYGGKKLGLSAGLSGSVGASARGAAGVSLGPKAGLGGGLRRPRP